MEMLVIVSLSYTRNFPSTYSITMLLPEASFHILNNFDIPAGAAREKQKDAHGNIVSDHTIWTSASDLKSRRYHFRTYEN